METIEIKEEIIENIVKLENYLCEGTDEERSFAVNLIKKGRCFVTYQVNGETRFCPSRFVGYKSNNMRQHEASQSKDGRETNPAITKALKINLEINQNLEVLLEEYCQSFGVTPDNVKKQFWDLESKPAIIIESEEEKSSFVEGGIVERMHLHRERNSRLIKVVKETFKIKFGKLFCQICEFNFTEMYGVLGEDFIEAHHTIAISFMNPNHQTKPEDIALVCANCHRMLHRKRPWLGISELKEILKR
jgi:5-methylcytosine-specific restriction protein A